jgi:hypothetical protein
MALPPTSSPFLVTNFSIANFSPSSPLALAVQINQLESPSVTAFHPTDLRPGKTDHTITYLLLDAVHYVLLSVPSPPPPQPSVMSEFNSSDYEDLEPPPPNPYAHLGARSIEKMLETRFDDRIRTKQRMVNLQDTKGSPGTVYARALWMRRFEAYLTGARGLRCG